MIIISAAAGPPPVRSNTCRGMSEGILHPNTCTFTCLVRESTPDHQSVSQNSELAAFVGPICLDGDV